MTLPPWRSNKPEDQQALSRFIIEELERADERSANAASDDTAAIRYLQGVNQVRQQARTLGLGVALPDAPRKRGPKALSLADDKATDFDRAVRDVQRIRALFRLHWGKRNRTERPMAEEIAAKRWELDAENTAALIAKFRKKT